MGVVQRIDDGERQLALHHIVTGGLAYLFRIEIVKDIVSYLEDDTNILSEFCSLIYFLVGSACRDGSYLGTSLKERSCLIVNNLIINVF